MSRRRPKRKSRRSLVMPRSAYRQNVRRADEVLSRNDVEIRADNWQQLALDWFMSQEPDRSVLARHIADYEDELGIPWAREILRLEVFFQAEDHLQIIDHYNRALSHYPRCAVVEMWVADYIFRHAGDFWRARQMYRYVVESLPDHPKSCYELGFMSYLLGDFPGALDWFDRAAERVANDDVEVGVRIFYNRGLVHYLLNRDKEPAIADMEEALRRKPDYPQAQEALRILRSEERIRWTQW
jgi:tetratricopeptide (TPR) repeat protein